MSRRNDDWDSDDEHYRPVFKGSRNYDGVGSKFGEAFNVNVDLGSASGKRLLQKEAKYKAHWLTHPDEKKVFPDNKGATNVEWPSPWH